MAERVQHLYGHIPFCHRICPYCGFYKHQPGKVSMKRLVDALLRDAEARSRDHQMDLRTVYFGGGTPSILPTAQWIRLAQGLKDIFGLESLEEWTLEANPKTFDRTRAEAWKESGVTRVSLGVQSFDPSVLDTLGRDHAPKDVEQAVAAVRESGITELNIDLMFSIPGQTLEVWRATLEAALAFDPDHISAYNLTYEEDTEFLETHRSGKGGWTVNPDRDADFFRGAHDRLTEAGLEHYEVSNYARPGQRSLHNQAYWQGSDYLSLGPSGVSTVGERRWRNLADTQRYVDGVLTIGHAWEEIEILTPGDRRLERLAMQLRTQNGIALTELAAESGQALVEEGLASIEGGRFVLTLEGMMVADEIAAYVS